VLFSLFTFRFRTGFIFFSAEALAEALADAQESLCR
jgi:hypothetical protein